MMSSVNVLAVGDVCGQSGIDILTAKLHTVIKHYSIAFTVVNGENAAGLGITPKQAETIRKAGADMITLGNHTWCKPDIKDYIDNNKHILRPANFAPQVPGFGWRVLESSFGNVCVINLLGRIEVNIESENPFLEADRILRKIDEKIILVDFHASATAEKAAMSYHLDGRVSALWGTHTHVQTSDARVLPGGTGFITDVGMTGVLDSIIGMKPDQSLSNFLGNPPERFISAEGESRIEAAVFEIDTHSGKCLSVETIRIM